MSIITVYGRRAVANYHDFSEILRNPPGAYTFQITITKTYNVTNLLEDIKALYKIAAFKGQPVAFIFT